MKLMGATWRRTGLSKAAMRAYYNDVHGPVVAKEPLEILRYVQNVVEDAVFYYKDPHVPITQPDGLTEIWHTDQDAFDRTFGAPYMEQVAWPDTLVYADMVRRTGVMGDERTVISSTADETGLVKTISFVLFPHGATDRRVPGLWDLLADTLRAQDLVSAGVRICTLVTEVETPNDRLRRMLDLDAGLRGVAGITMVLDQSHSWEMAGVAAALAKAGDEAFQAEPFVLTMLVTPNVVIDGPGAAGSAGVASRADEGKHS